VKIDQKQNDKFVYRVAYKQIQTNAVEGWKST